MEKKDLIDLLNGIFLPLGFKRKGNNWILNGEEVNKIINLQKSQYSNSFYINYGYNINRLPLNGFATHIEDRLGSSDMEVNKFIHDLLNLENGMDITNRIIDLSKFIINKIVTEMQSVHNELDVLQVLNQRAHLYMVAPNVLTHFNLELR